MRVLEGRDVADLPQELLQIAFVHCHLGQHDLERDALVVPDAPCQIDGAEAAASFFLLDDVATNLLLDEAQLSSAGRSRRR